MADTGFFALHGFTLAVAALVVSLTMVEWWFGSVCGGYVMVAVVLKRRLSCDIIARKSASATVCLTWRGNWVIEKYR